MRFIPNNSGRPAHYTPLTYPSQTTSKSFWKWCPFTSLPRNSCREYICDKVVNILTTKGIYICQQSELTISGYFHKNLSFTVYLFGEWSDEMLQLKFLPGKGLKRILGLPFWSGSLLPNTQKEIFLSPHKYLRGEVR